VSRSTGQVAFCATAPGADVGDRLAQSELWAMDFDGQDVRPLAAPGLSCAEPAFAPDGGTIAFTVDETGANPPRFSIWVVSAEGRDEQRLSSQSDEWSRFGPQWIDANRLVYAASAEDGRSTLFVFNTASTAEQDIGADLVRGETYQSLGRPLVAPDGGAIAVEGLRPSGAGADLLLIGPDGEALPNQGQIAGGYWNRPLAWGTDGTLFYMTTACASDVAQSYTLRTRSLAGGDDSLIASGATLGGFGSFAAADKGLAYVALDHAPAGPRGPLQIDPQSQSALWFWDVGGMGGRARLVSAQSAIGAVAP
jgi:hypothetical protein